MKRPLLYLALVLLTMVLLVPLIGLAGTSVKGPSDLAAYPPRLWPADPQWDNYTEALKHIPFARYLRNSLVVAGVYSVLVTLSSAFVGFGFARLHAPGKSLLFGVLIGTMMLPHLILLFPQFLVFSRIGVVGTYWPWVLWGASGSAFLIFMFRQFFAGLPKELEEAAVLDGCGYLRIFSLIFLPQAWPALATSLILSFTFAWGDYVGPLLLLPDEKTTLAVALANGYLDQQGNPLHQLLAAGATLYVLPVLLLFLVAQRRFVSGFATSGLK